MIQKRSYSLIIIFYYMVKIHFITKNNMNIFTIYKLWLSNIIKILPTIYPNTANVPGKRSKFY